MDVDNYQTAAARTLISEPDTTFTNEEIAIMLGALELGAAVGKVLEYCKKGICHRHGFGRIEMNEKLVDVTRRAVKLMTLDAPYQQLILSGNEQMILWCALGLGGEAGEVMETISEIPGCAVDMTSVLVKELGDNDWYNAALCTLIGVPMSDVMQANVSKLEQRYKNGYSSEESKARVDTL